MSDAVEIYVCFEGQALKDGKVEYSNSIYDKHGAEQDAEARVRRNPKIHKIAYYRVNAEGDFRIFYSFTNPNPVSAQNSGAPDEQKPKPKRKAVKRSWWRKMLGLKAKPPKKGGAKKRAVKTGTAKKKTAKKS